MKTLTADHALSSALHHHALSDGRASPELIASELLGLHNTTQAGPYLSLFARSPGFRREELEDVMWGSWRLVRFRAMRLTMFVMPRDLLEIAAAATRHFSAPFATRWLRDSGLSSEEFAQMAADIDTALMDGPLTARQLRNTLGAPQSVPIPGIVSRMCDRAQLVGGAPPHSWRSTIRQYHRWQDVLPDVDIGRWDEHAAIRALVHRYVRSYGPVTIDDISWWTGIAKGRCRRAMEELHAEVEEVAVEGWPGPLFRLKEAAPDAAPDETVRALPLLDPYVQGYRDRVRFLDPARSTFVYDGGGNAAATLLHRGRIVGVWQVTDEPGVRYHLFDECPGSLRRGAEECLAATARFYFDEPVEVVGVATMEPLNAGGGRSAAHPLDGRLHRASRRNR